MGKMAVREYYDPVEKALPAQHANELAPPLFALLPNEKDRTELLQLHGSSKNRLRVVSPASARKAAPEAPRSPYQHPVNVSSSTRTRTRTRTHTHTRTRTRTRSHLHTHTHTRTPTPTPPTPRQTALPSQRSTGPVQSLALETHWRASAVLSIANSAAGTKRFVALRRNARSSATIRLSPRGGTSAEIVTEGFFALLLLQG
jgi:hypothetical protein